MLQDLRYAIRMIRQHPWFSAAIIGTLALGIGVNTTVFTLVNAVLFKPLPFPGGDRLVMVPATQPAQGRNQVSLSYADLRDFRQSTTSFEYLEAFSGLPVTVSENGNPPERYRGVRITSGLFAMLRMQPVAGRALGPDDEKPGAESVMVIGYGVWKDRYGKDPGVIGRAIRANDKTAVIVGVMPEGFKFPNNEDVWMNAVPTEQLEKRDNRSFMMIGMRKPGVTIPAAQADLDVVARRLEQQFPDSHKGYSIAVRTFHETMNGGPIRVIFLLMLGAVGFVLLIACANVANMLLGRALSRRREISIRVAMGAGRARILRQLLVESVLLSALGGLLGLGLSRFAVEAFSKAVQNVGKPSWIIFEMDYVVFGYLAAVCILSGILFGIVPALQATRIDLNEALKEGSKSSSGRRSGYLSAALVVFQFTLAVVLLSAAGLMIRSFLVAQQEFAGIDASQILHARVNLPNSRFSTPEARRQFFEKLLPRLAALPGVKSVAMTSNTPGDGAQGRRFEISGQPVPEPERRPGATVLFVSPGYLRLIGQSLAQGRDFEQNDGLPGKEAVIVTREFAAKHFAGQDAIGKQLRLFQGNNQPAAWMTVIGIAPDIRQSNPGNQAPDPLVILPYISESQGGMAALLQIGPAAPTLAPALRREVQQLDGELPLFDVGTLAETLERSRWYLRVFGTLFFSFAFIAMGMAAVGIYAVLAHATAARTREIGVRLALGANARAIVGMVLNRGLIQIAIGMALGLTAAFFACRLMTQFLFKVSPSDPLTFGMVTLTLCSAGLAACLIPARRASRLDPLVALRHE
ncbi:MAG: ABC transporter permease [Acidobacteria bacterium]|nr:ABC transporter permease [Acidobacteriota bacterium]